MKLIIERTRASVAGGKLRPRFTLTCRVELDEERFDLLNEYDMRRHMLVFIEPGDVRDFQPGDENDRSITLDQLCSEGGWSIRSEHALDLLGVESSLRAACRSLVDELHVLDSYEGRDEIEY